MIHQVAIIAEESGETVRRPCNPKDGLYQVEAEGEVIKQCRNEDYDEWKDADKFWSNYPFSTRQVIRITPFEVVEQWKHKGSYTWADGEPHSSIVGRVELEYRKIIRLK